ncbi:MAG: pyruvate kinase [Anaerolineae bacterium]
MPRTKIVCTIGPACQSEERLRAMIQAGMDVARFNFSHGDHPTHTRDVALVRRLAEEEGQVVAIMQDLQGPRIRIGNIAAGSAILREGATFTLTSEQVPGDETEVTLPHPQVPPEVKAGHRILLDDGLLELEVQETDEREIRCRVVTGGVLKPRKGVTLPQSTLTLPALTEKDKEDLAWGLIHEVDYIALSFVRSAADIEELRGWLADHEAEIPIIAKIEKHEAVANFDEILAASDAVMVARGDLGLETPAEEVPIYQKMIINKANAAGKPVITATQMLDSMIRNPRPTRAEASDVANAILDGTDAVMLSGETAVGKYPVEAVKTMARLALTTERNFPYQERVRQASIAPSLSVTDAISQATCEIANELGAQAIITSTRSGRTAQAVAKYRPATPIVATTSEPRTRRRLALVWGVEPLLIPHSDSTDETMTNAVSAARQAGLVKGGDKVVITAGVPPGIAGHTNILKVHVVESLHI